MRRALSTALVTGLLATAAMPSIGAQAAARAPICDDTVELLAFRGSGENDGEPGATGWLGPKLKAIVDEGRAMTTPDGVNLAHVPVHAVPAPGYPAIHLDEYFKPDQLRLDPAKMMESANQGASAAYAHMLTARHDCPSRQFLLLGYSQGATAARAVLRYAPDSWIAGAFLIGDPERAGGAAYAHRGGGDGSLLVAMRAMGGDVTKLLPDKVAGRSFPAYSFCHEHDIVCDVSLGAGTDTHVTYGQTLSERQALATQIIDMYRRARNNPPPPANKPPLDVVFAIDTTGSMTPYINGARDSAAAISAQLAAGTSSFRVGLAEYRDHGDPFVARMVTPLTTDSAAFRSGLDTLVANGGGDLPEAVYSGMITAAGAAWRSDVRRIVIVIGDAPAHDPEPVTNYTKADVIAAYTVSAAAARSDGLRLASAAVGEPIRLYGLAADGDLKAQLDAIAEATGGLSLSLGDPADVAEQIAASLGDATAAPSITLTASAPAFAGQPVTLTAVDPNSPAGLTYHWDFDGDGNVDQIGTTGSVSHVYPAPGSITARVKVDDPQGRQATASTAFTVLAKPGEVALTIPSPSPGPSSSAGPSPSVSASPEVTASAGSSGPGPGGSLSRTGNSIVTIVLIGLSLLGTGAIILVILTFVRRRRGPAESV